MYDDFIKEIDDLRCENSNLNYKLYKKETQQKKFINYLEDKIYTIEPKGTSINFNCEYDSEEDYLRGIRRETRLNALKEILQKHKSIIGVSDETN